MSNRNRNVKSRSKPTSNRVQNRRQIKFQNQRRIEFVTDGCLGSPSFFFSQFLRPPPWRELCPNRRPKAAAPSSETCQTAEAAQRRQQQLFSVAVLAIIEESTISRNLLRSVVWALHKVVRHTCARGRRLVWHPKLRPTQIGKFASTSLCLNLKDYMLLQTYNGFLCVWLEQHLHFVQETQSRTPYVRFSWSKYMFKDILSRIPIQYLRLVSKACWKLALIGASSLLIAWFSSLCWKCWRSSHSQARESMCTALCSRKRTMLSQMVACIETHFFNNSELKQRF